MSKNQLLKKKMEAGAAKPSTTGLFDEDSSKKKDKDKKKDGWSDEEDDYKIDVQVNEKKGNEGSKPVIVNTAAAWKDVDLKIDNNEPAKNSGKKWGDGIKTGGEKVDNEAFPSIGEEIKPEKKSQPQSTLGRSNFTATSQLNQEPEGDGRIKLKNSKGVTNSVLTAKPLAPLQAPVPAPAPVEKPVQTGGLGSSLANAFNGEGGVIKLKGKCKVEYKETSAEKKQREAEEEVLKKELEKRKADKERAAANFDKKKTVDGKPHQHDHKDGLHKETHHKDGQQKTFGGAHQEGRGQIKPTDDGKMGRGHIQTAKEKAEQQVQ